MTPFDTRGACVALAALAALAVACADQPVTPSRAAIPDAISAAQLAANAGNAQSMVVKTIDYDYDADGVLEFRVFVTTWYDARGNALREETLVDEGAIGVMKDYVVSVVTYNQHGFPVASASERDFLVNGIIDNRYRMETVEYDRNGNPTKQVYFSDETGDGIFEAEEEATNGFNTRGELTSQIAGGSVMSFTYDPHGNLAGLVSLSPATYRATYDYNAHDALISRAEDWGAYGTATLSTLEYDRQGNPLRQVYEAKNSAGTISRTVITATYDGHFNPLTVVEEYDAQPVDGEVDVDQRKSVTYQYSGAVIHVKHERQKAVPAPPAAISKMETVPARRDPGVVRTIP